MQLTMRQSQILKDLKFPLLWMPIITFVADFILCMIGLDNELKIEPQIIFSIIFSLVHSLLSTFLYLIIPLIIRFLILKRPMREQSYITYIVSIAIGIFVKVITVALGLLESGSTSIPILNIIAIDFVLTAGYKMQQFIYREPGTNVQDSTENKIESPDIKNISKMKITKWPKNIFMTLFCITYIVLGLVQLAAIIAGLKYWLEWPFIIRAFIGMPLSYIPIIGQIIGTMGAVVGWDWSYPAAILIFFGPYIFYLGIFFLFLAVDKTKEHISSNRE